MKIDNSLIKLNISDIKEKFKCWEGMKLEIFVDSDVVIKFANEELGEVKNELG